MFHRICYETNYITMRLLVLKTIIFQRVYFETAYVFLWGKYIKHLCLQGSQIKVPHEDSLYNNAYPNSLDFKNNREMCEWIMVGGHVRIYRWMSGYFVISDGGFVKQDCRQSLIFSKSLLEAEKKEKNVKKSSIEKSVFKWRKLQTTP